MKIVVIATDATHAVHIGGEIERVARSFDAPPGLVAFIEKFRGTSDYASVSLALDYEADQQGGSNG